MSYSYVKTVFPNFKYSNIYDTKLYESLNVSQHDSGIFEPAELNTTTQYSPSPKPLIEHQKETSKIETFQNNQTFFTQPLPVNNIPKNNNIINRESFNTETPNQSHVEYTKHVLECGACKELLMKHFGIENERIRNEELMELISYIIFGLFILLLIDTYANK